MLLFSAVSDKEYEKIADILCGRVKAGLYIITQIQDARGVPARELGRIFRERTDSPVLVEPDPARALAAAVSNRCGRRIYCLGSLYLIGELKRILTEQGDCVQRRLKDRC